MEKQMKSKKQTAVMVTTSHRGVFFGYAAPGTDFAADKIRLSDSRMCVFWSTDCKGVLGLAATGPTASCKIGPKVPAITLRDVTSVTEVSDSAVEAWETAPWR